MQQLTTDTFEVSVSNGIVLLKFGAIWCNPCRMIDRILVNVEKTFTINDSIIFGRIDVDESPELAQKFGITSVPTMIFMKDGNIISTMTGIQSEKTIVDTITNIKEN